MPYRETLMQSLEFLDVYIGNFLLPRLKLIITTPFTHPDLLWLVIPLIFVLFAIQLYFGRNRTEQLGWNTAFGNSISLFWVIVLLLRFTIVDTHISELFQGRTSKELILIGILAIWTILLLTSDFYHALPKKLAFLLSSSIPINTMAFLFIVIILGDIPIDRTTFVAGFVLLILAAIFFRVMRSVIKPSPSAEKTLERKALEKKRHKELRKERIKRKIEKIEGKIKQEARDVKRKLTKP